MRTRPKISHPNAPRAKTVAAKKPWVSLAGKLRHLQKETARVNRVIEQEFERIEPEEWA